MHMPAIPFELIEWSQQQPVEYPGTSGTSRWRIRELGAMRLRLVEYSAGFRADHWCRKGHVIFCLSGSLRVELDDGRAYALEPGQTIVVGDDDGAHVASSAEGARVFIVD